MEFCLEQNSFHLTKVSNNGHFVRVLHFSSAWFVIRHRLSEHWVVKKLNWFKNNVNEMQNPCVNQN